MRLKPSRDICIELQDNSTATKSAVDFFAVPRGRNAESQAARLADQFINQNERLFAKLEVSPRRDYDGRDVLLHIESRNAIGAIPLISPYNARPDFGLVIQPRFPWPGIGPMLSEMGWLIVPTPLRLPLLKRSERRVPQWVISCMVLPRLKALLDRLDRRFEMVSEFKAAPKGRVDWSVYVNREIARGRFLSVPCTFPDLRDDRQLKGAIRFAVEKQIQSLETQRQYGAFIHRLIAFAESLLLRVQGVTSRQPGGQELEAWARRPFRADALTNGLQAIEWTVEERGLAGLSDLEGISWTMPMEQFFEAWVETVLRKVALRTGGKLRVARRHETVSPISWDPPYLGSQGSLIPDILLEQEDMTLIVDAKYKRHWEEINAIGWHGTENEIRERHRPDLLQVLAYANLTSTPRVVCCLAYPCSWERWELHARSGRLFHCAHLPNRGRIVEVWLTGVPMHAAVEEIANAFAAKLQARQVPGQEDQESSSITSLLAGS
jgi:hypothetical protein